MLLQIRILSISLSRGEKECGRRRGHDKNVEHVDDESDFDDDDGVNEKVEQWTISYLTKGNHQNQTRPSL